MDDKEAEMALKMMGAFFSGLASLGFTIAATNNTSGLIGKQVLLNAENINLKNVDQCQDGDFIKISGYATSDDSVPLKTYKQEGEEGKTNNALLVLEKYTEVCITGFTNDMDSTKPGTRLERTIQVIGKQVPLYLGSKGSSGIITRRIPITMPHSQLAPIATVVETDFYPNENTEGFFSKVVRFAVSSSYSLGVRVETLAIHPGTKMSMVCQVRENTRSAHTGEPRMELRWPKPNPLNPIDYTDGYVFKGSIEDMEDELQGDRNSLAKWAAFDWACAGTLGYLTYSWIMDCKRLFNEMDASSS